MTGGLRRRRVLAKAGVLGAAVLAGCSSDGDSSDDDSSADSGGGTGVGRSDDAGDTGTGDSGGSTDSGTDSDTGSGPSDEELLSQTHPATEIASVVQQLEQYGVTLNIQPADPDADYADSVVFSEFSASGEDVLDVELDLGQAIQQRHHTMPEIWGDPDEQNPAGYVQEFVNNIDDPEWRQQIIDEAEESYNEEYEEFFNWDTYTDDSLSYGERMRDSGMITFWYIFERQRFGGISSAHNQYKAQALQGAERVAGFDTFVWDHNIPGHGLVGAIENPTRSDGDAAQQETYIVETDFGDGQQVRTWENSQYSQSGLHPAREEVDRREADFFSRTAIGGFEADLYESVDVPMSGAEEFIEFFRNPESSPAYDHLDPIAAAAYIAEENIVNGDGTGTVDLGTDAIEYRA